MEIWIEPTDLEFVSDAKKVGLVFGISTNPTIVAKSNQGVDQFFSKLIEIHQGPLAIQVTASKADKMIRQAKELRRFSDQIFVKIPVTVEGLSAIYTLNQEQVPTIATEVFTVPQALLAARAGARYIAPYYAKICDEDVDGREVVRAMPRLIAHYKYLSKILMVSLSTPEQVKECCEMGIDAVVLSKKVFRGFLEDHPLTIKSVNDFAKDWKTVKPNQFFLD